MRRSAIIVVFFCIAMMWSATGCTDKKKAVVEDVATDTIADTTMVDSLEALTEEVPVPKTADELFDDFFFTFASNRQYQRSRVLFPLKVVNGKRTKTMQKRQWRMESFFMKQGYYTLILDNHRQLNLSKDTSINQVVVEKIFLDRHVVKKYNFERMEGLWKLKSIEENAPYQPCNASFLSFYEKFSTDTLFQMESLNETMEFSGPDPENDMEELTGEISAEQWPDFSPGELPHGVLYNIMYGQTYQEDDEKILLLRGISSGQEMEMTFRHMDEGWKLVRLKE